MDQVKLIDLAYEYAKSIKKTNQYLELINLKEKIDKELSIEVKEFKKYDKLYNEAKAYGKYHPSLSEYQTKLVSAKTKLYNHEIVIRYKELENSIQESINSFFENLLNEISNKYKI